MLMTRAENLQPGDIVTNFDGPYNSATVKKINEDGSVQLMRPYVHRDEETGILFIGVENYSIRAISTVCLQKTGDRRVLSKPVCWEQSPT